VLLRSGQESIVHASSGLLVAAKWNHVVVGGIDPDWDVIHHGAITLINPRLMLCRIHAVESILDEWKHFPLKLFRWPLLVSPKVECGFPESRYSKGKRSRETVQVELMHLLRTLIPPTAITNVINGYTQ